jgi:competence protein ComEC
VHDAALRGAEASLVVRLTGDPHPLRSQGYAGRAGGVDRVLVPGELVHATIAGQGWGTGGSVALLAPAGGWLDLLPGQQVTASGTLAPPAGGGLEVAALRVRGPPAAVGPAPWWQRVAGSLRAGLRTASARLPEASAGLLPGLVVGDTGRLPPDLADEFRVAGLSHLTAVSGTNITILAGAVVGLLALCGAGPRTRAVAGLVVIAGFVVLARPSPSVLRAAVMGGIGLLGLGLGRRRAALPALSAAVILLLLADPELAIDAGFTLSVLATGALILLAPTWAHALHRAGVPAVLAEALAVPTAAHVVTAPVAAAISGQLSLVAIVANLLAEPAVAPATVLGVLAAVLAPLSPTVASWPVTVAGPEVGWLVTVGQRAAAVPGAAVRWPDGASGGLLLAAVLGALVLVLRRRRIRVLAAAALLGALLVLLPTRFVTPGWPVTGWAMVSCDVGQGDAAVLATADPGTAVVIDTGPDPGAVDGCLDRLGVHSVALVVLTHLHADHVDGLPGVLDGRPVAAVATGPLHQPAWALDTVRATTARHGVPLLAMAAGDRLRWPGLELEVLAPLTPPPRVLPAGDTGTPINDASLVIRAHTAAGTVLLCGDIELAAQSALLASGVDLRADVLKVPHHGSRYSVPAFLDAVRPRVALVSVGAGNPYGHPSTGVLDHLAAGGASVLRTDRSGDIAVTPADDESTPDGLRVVARGSPRPAPRG